MQRIIRALSSRSLKPATIFALGFLALFTQLGRAQDNLHYFRNYFVTENTHPEGSVDSCAPQPGISREEGISVDVIPVEVPLDLRIGGPSH